MERYKVIVPRLNVRKAPVDNFKVKNIITTVNEGLTLDLVEVIDVPNPSLGKWYTDGKGQFYSGLGLAQYDSSKITFIDSSQNKLLNNKDWGFIDFKIDELWKYSRGENIQVAILDSGLNYDLDDFKNKTDITYYNAFTNSEKKEDCFDNTDGHGTDCAGILCAQGYNVWGVAPDITLNIIKITNSQGERTFPAILKGLQKAIDIESDVISLSFSFDKNNNNAKIVEEIYKKIQEAINKNIIIVASADDGDLDFPIDNFPASFTECISVGAIDRFGKVASNKSNFLDLMAPGKDVLSVFNKGKTISGASFSTPFTAGIVAILKSIIKKNNYKITNYELMRILERSANTNFKDYNKLEFGFGIIDPVQAHNLLLIKNQIT